jgi:hypothetical protein
VIQSKTLISTIVPLINAFSGESLLTLDIGERNINLIKSINTRVFVNWTFVDSLCLNETLVRSATSGLTTIWPKSTCHEGHTDRTTVLWYLEERSPSHQPLCQQLRSEGVGFNWLPDSISYTSKFVLQLLNAMCLSSVNRLWCIGYMRSNFICIPKLSRFELRGCIQKSPDWPPGARTANGTTLCH